VIQIAMIKIALFTVFGLTALLFGCVTRLVLVVKCISESLRGLLSGKEIANLIPATAG
jgi:hypothetical protein